MDKPKRAYHFTATVDGDTLEDVIGFLTSTIINLERGTGQAGTTVSGGYSSGGITDLVVNPEMTHERYVELLNAYCDALPVANGE